MATTSLLFDKILKHQHWNLSPQNECVFPSANAPILNAATALAICAYPQLEKLKLNGKAHRYQQALIAYMYRASLWTGRIECLPEWVRNLKSDKMWDRLYTGHRNLSRSFVVRDLVIAALIEKRQSDDARRGGRSTFTMAFSPDLRSFKIEIPIKKEAGQHFLSGKIPEDNCRSIRTAIKRHREALVDFEGVSPRPEGSDEEGFYQNTLNRFVRPALYTMHIMQVVWEAATQHQEEAKERNLPIDQILMRKANWAADIYTKTNTNAGMAIQSTRELGIAGCHCKLIQFSAPSPYS